MKVISLFFCGSIACAFHTAAATIAVPPLSTSSALEQVRCKKVCAAYKTSSFKDPGKGLYGSKSNGQYVLKQKRTCYAWGVVCDK